MADTFDLDAYLRRVGYEGSVQPDLRTLRALHRRHLDAIPFENLDIQMGGSVSLDAAALQAALVHRRRGGYCFQQNGLLHLALRSAGFQVRACEARVRQGANGVIRPRTHMALIVPLGGREWLVDVGFGGDGFVEPLALAAPPSEQEGWMYEVAGEGREWVLRREGENGWEDLYAFLPDPVQPIDYVVANWFTSTHPESSFVRTLTAQRISGGTRRVLRNLIYTTWRGPQPETRVVRRDALVPLLRDGFDLDVPDDARFRAVDGRAP